MRKKIVEKTRNQSALRAQSMKTISLDRRAYVGAPRPLRSPMGRDDIELPSPRPHWSYKSKKVRKREIIDNL